jgi:hypothetical protein
MNAAPVKRYDPIRESFPACRALDSLAPIIDGKQAGETGNSKEPKNERVRTKIESKEAPMSKTAGIRI